MEDCGDFFEEEDLEQSIHRDRWRQLVGEAGRLDSLIKRVQSRLLAQTLPEEKRLRLEARLERHRQQMLRLLKNLKIPPLHLNKIVRKINDYGYAAWACQREMAACMKKAGLDVMEFRRLTRSQKAKNSPLPADLPSDMVNLAETWCKAQRRLKKIEQETGQTVATLLEIQARLQKGNVKPHEPNVN